MSASDVARALQSFRAAASEKGAYGVQRDSAAALLRYLDRHFGSSVGEPPTAAVVTALHTLRTTLDRLLVNISCRMAQRASTLPPIRASLADTRRNAAMLCRQLERHWPEAAPPSPDAAPSPTAAPSVATHPPAIDGSCPLLSRCGPRHLCAYGCFFDAFEPARRLQSLRAALEARGATGACLDGWRVERVRSGASASSSPARGDGAEGGKRRRTTGCAASPGATTSSSSSWHFVSPSGATFASVVAAVRAFADGAPPTSGGRQGGPSTSGGWQGGPRGLEARSVSAESEDAAAGLRRVTSPYFKDRPPSGAVQPTPPRALGATDAGGRANWRPPRSPYGLLEELLWDRPWALLLACILLNQTTRRQVPLQRGRGREEGEGGGPPRPQRAWRGSRWTR